MSIMGTRCLNCNIFNHFESVCHLKQIISASTSIAYGNYDHKTLTFHRKLDSYHTSETPATLSISSPHHNTNNECKINNSLDSGTAISSARFKHL